MASITTFFQIAELVRKRVITPEEFAELLVDFEADPSTPIEVRAKARGWALAEVPTERSDSAPPQVELEETSAWSSPPKSASPPSGNGTPRVALDGESASEVDDEHPTVASPPEAAPGDPQPPPTLLGSRYRTEKFHAKGGIGLVWKVNDQHLQRTVALKSLRPDRWSLSTAQARFLDEARVTAQLEHPSIVPLYDLLEGDDPSTCFYTMKFVEGSTLAEAARVAKVNRMAGQATERELTDLVRAFLAVAQAVSFAHSKGVLHRDLKGQNVVLGKFGEVFLLDWGMAKLDEESGDDSRVSVDSSMERGNTVPNKPVGTIAYSSPEQRLGALDRIDQRSDVYGLGAMLYEVLTASPPFDSSTLSSSREEIESAIPPAPKVSNPAAPPPLAAIAMKALQPRPEDRYQTVESLIEDVERWLAGEPVGAFPEPWTDRAARWARRHRTAVATSLALLAATTVALAAIAGVVSWSRHRISIANAALADSNKKLEKSLKDLETETERATTRGDVARRAVSQILARFSDEALGPLPDTLPVRRAIMEESTVMAEQLLATSPKAPELLFDVAQVWRYAANLERQTAEYPRAFEHYGLALDALKRAREVSPDDDRYEIRYIETQVDRGDTLQILGRYQDAVADYTAALQLAQKLLAAEDSDIHRRLLATAGHGFGSLLLDQGDTTRSRTFAEDAVATFQRLDEEKKVDPKIVPLQRVMAHQLLGRVERAEGRGEQARKQFEAAEARARELLAADARDANVRITLAGSLDNLIELDLADPAKAADAERRADEAVELRRQLLLEAKVDPNMAAEMARSYSRRASARIQRSKFDEAIEDLDDSERLARQLVENVKENLMHRTLLVQSLILRGDLEAGRGRNLPARTAWKKASDELKLAEAAAPGVGYIAFLRKELDDRMKGSSEPETR